MRESNVRNPLEEAVYNFLDYNDAVDVKDMLKEMLSAYIGSDMAETRYATYNAGVLFLYFQLCELVDRLEANRPWLELKKGGTA